MPGYFNNRVISLIYPVCFIALFLCLFSACASQNIYRKLSDTEYTSPDYIVLERWTRDGSIHKGLKTELLVTVTYKGEKFRRAYTKEYAGVYMLKPHQEKIMMDDQIEAAKDYDDFLVSRYTPEKKWDDFS